MLPWLNRVPHLSFCAHRAERNGNGGGFVTGFVVGGAIFGALGFLFAPQISAALLSEDQRLKLPKFLDEEEKDPEATKQACPGISPYWCSAHDN